MLSLAEQIDRLFAPWDRPNSPGCALGVVRGGELVYARGYGLASLEHGIPITPTTVFHLASMSKQFTACAIFLLAAEGRLSLDDPARRYIPEIPAFDEEKQAGPITLRHLMHHTSGLRDQFGLALTGKWRIGDVLTTGDILGLLARQRELNFAPGTETMYCNTGYTLLGLAVERVAGRPLRDWLAERIFAPLGMRDTRVRDDPAEVVRHVACAYAPQGADAFTPNKVGGVPGEGGEFVRSTLLTLATAGASSVYSTVQDLAKWDDNLYHGTVGGPEVAAQMVRPGTLRSGQHTNYAGGLWTGAYRGLRTVEHDGEDGGYRCDLLRFPDQHFSVILLGNVSNLGHTARCRQVADVCLADAFPEAAPALEASGAASEPQPQGPAPMPESDLPEYAGSYYSPELDSRCTFAAEGGLLFLLRPKHDPVPFAPLGADSFAVGPASLRFIRGEGGRIDGFRVTFEGVRNLKYVRE